MSDYRNDPIADEADLLAMDEIDALSASPRPAAGERLVAKADEMVGKAEDLVRRKFGDEAAGKVRHGADVAMVRAEDAVDAGRRRLDRELLERPYQTLALAAGAGLVLGLWLRR